MRITGSDWIDGALGPDDAAVFACELKAIGFDYVCVSSGGISPQARVAVAPGYQVPFAETVKRAGRITVQAVGMIANPRQAEKIVAKGRADCVALPAAFSITRVGHGTPPMSEGQRWLAHRNINERALIYGLGPHWLIPTELTW